MFIGDDVHLLTLLLLVFSQKYCFEERLLKNVCFMPLTNHKSRFC